MTRASCLWLLCALALPARARTFAYVSVSCSDAPCALPSMAPVFDLGANRQVDSARLDQYAFALAITPDGGRAYLTSSLARLVYVLDVATAHIVDTIPLGVEGGYIAIQHDGRRAYVTAYAPLTKSASLRIIRTSNNKVIGSVPLPAAANGIAAAPDGSRVYVALSSGELAILDTSTDQVTMVHTGSPLLEGVAITPDGSRAYLSGYLDQQSTGIMVMDTATNAMVSSLNLGGQLYGVSISPDGTLAYVATTGTVYAVATGSNTVQAAINVGSQPISIVFTPDGTRAYVADAYNSTVPVIDTAANQVTGALISPAPPRQIAITPDGRRAMATVRAGAVGLLDGKTARVLMKSPVGAGAAGIAVSADGTRAYIADSGSNTVSVIHPLSGQLLQTWTVRGNPASAVLTRDGSRLYVISVQSYGGYITVLDTSSGAVVKEFPVPSLGESYGVPEAIVIAPDGARIYVSVAEIPFDARYTANGLVLVFDTAATSLKHIIFGGGGGGLALAPDGQTLYVGGAIGTAVISTSSNRVVDVIPGVAGYLAVSPDGSRLYAAFLNQVSVINTANNWIVGQIDLPGYAGPLAFTPDGSRALVTGASTSLTVIDTASSAVVGTVPVGGVSSGIAFFECGN